MKLILSILLILLSFQTIAVSWKEIRSDMVKKYKGGPKIKDQSMVMIMKTVSEGRKMDIKMKFFGKGNKFRVDSKVMGMNTTTIFDGKAGWSVMMGRKQKLPDSHTNQFKNIGVKNPVDELPKKAKFLKTETIQGHSCYKIQVLGVDKKNVDKMWIDTKLLVARKMSGNDTVTSLSNFKKILNFYQVPQNIKVTMKKNITEAIIKSIKINSGLKNSHFDINKVSVSTPKMDMNQMMKMMKGMKKPR